MPASPRRGKKPADAQDSAKPQDKPRQPRTKKPKDEEERLDQAIRDVLGSGPEKLTPVQWRSLRETWRVSLLYPGRHVAFLDHHEGQGWERRLVRREVLCVSRSLTALNKRLNKMLRTMPQGSEFRVHVTYVEPPDALPWL